MKDFRAALSLFPAFISETGTTRTSDQVPDSLFPPIILSYSDHIFLCRRHELWYIWSSALPCHTLQYREEINNIQSVIPEGEIVHELTQLCNMTLLQNLTGVHTGTPSTPHCLHEHAFLRGNYTGECFMHTHTHTHTDSKIHTIHTVQPGTEAKTT